MDSNPLDALLDRMGWIGNDAVFKDDGRGYFTVVLSARERDELRRLLAVVKAAYKECREHRASVVASTIRSAMSTAAEVPHGQ